MPALRPIDPHEHGSIAASRDRLRGGARPHSVLEQHDKVPPWARLRERARPGDRRLLPSRVGTDDQRVSRPQAFGQNRKAAALGEHGNKPGMRKHLHRGLKEPDRIAGRHVHDVRATAGLGRGLPQTLELKMHAASVVQNPILNGDAYSRVFLAGRSQKIR